MIDYTINAGVSVCPVCFGARGSIRIEWDDKQNPIGETWIMCQACNGTGRQAVFSGRLPGHEGLQQSLERIEAELQAIKRFLDGTKEGSDND